MRKSPSAGRVTGAGRVGVTARSRHRDSGIQIIPRGGGCWLLAVACWLLAIGYWPLARKRSQRSSRGQRRARRQGATGLAANGQQPVASRQQPDPSCVRAVVAIPCGRRLGLKPARNGRRRGGGRAAVRCGDAIIGVAAVAAGNGRVVGGSGWGVIRRRRAGAEPGRVQLHVHRVWVRDGDASPVQRRTGLLRIISGNAGGSRRLLQPERLRRAVRAERRLVFRVMQLG